jgi:nucleotide-binding universal stress UspA family protein
MAFVTVLAAVDLRRRPDPAMTSGARLAGLTGAQLHVLHCTQEGAAPRITTEVLEELSPASARLTVEEGEPADLIARHAVHTAADVIVLGPRVERSPLAGLLGSTADKVIRDARVPCLLSNAPLAEEPARILVAMDRSVPARDAFGVSRKLARTLAGRGVKGLAVHLVTISAFAQPGRRGAAPVDLGRYAEKLQTAAPMAKVSHGILSAALPAEGILSCAHSFGPDLLIIGTHGSGVLGRLLMGSVAQAVAREAALPLLLVPPKRRRGRPTEAA